MLTFAVRMATRGVAALFAMACATLGGAAMVTATGVLAESGLTSHLPAGRLGGADVVISASQTYQASGDLPIAEVGYNSVLDAAPEGVPVMAVGGGVQNTYGGEFYARKDSAGINKQADVRSWAYTNPGSSIYALSFMIPETGSVNPSSLRSLLIGGPSLGSRKYRSPPSQTHFRSHLGIHRPIGSPGSFGRS